MASEVEVLDLLVVGAGPTGIAIGAEARKEGLEPLLVDRGALAANILELPTYMKFFTTRQRLEIADIPFTIPENKPDRRQALSYYRSVVSRYRLPLALHEEVLSARLEGEYFEVASRSHDEERRRRAKAVALATGYFHNPKRLSVPGEERPWVHYRYREPYAHFGEQVVVVGGGNSAVEAALDLWRNGARVTLVHRGDSLKQTVKYWLKPDAENRIADGDIAVRFNSRVVAFADYQVEILGPRGSQRLSADAAYVLVGYTPDVALQERCGVAVDPQTLVPSFDPGTCESNVAGLYIAGTLQAGAQTDLIFIENSREHGRKIVAHLAQRLRSRSATAPAR